MIEFRVATQDDFDDFFSLKSEPNNVFWSGFAAPPNRESFKIH